MSDNKLTLISTELEKPKQTRNRKPKYETNIKPFLNRVTSWRQDGLDEVQIALRLNISYASLKRYKNKYPEFEVALIKGKEHLVDELKNSLFERAKGFEYEEVKQYIEEIDGKQRKRVEKTKKHIYSDQCLLFALKNIDPDNWRDKKEIQQDVNSTVQYLTIDVVDEEDKSIKLLEGDYEKEKIN